MANEIVKKEITKDLYSYSISYDAGSDCGPMSGMHLTGGVPAGSNGVKVVKFEQKIKNQVLCLKYDGRPDLAALVAEYNGIQANIKAAREAKWAAQQATQDAIDTPLIEAMHARAAELRAQMPADHIEVAATKIGDADGDPIMQYTAGGEIVSWQDITVVGWASAIRPGAMGSFASIQICSISIDKLEQIKAAKAAAETKKAAEQKTETDRINDIFVLADETGEKQLLKSYMADCNDSREECSTDIVTVWAMPDGTKTTTRQHTW